MTTRIDSQQVDYASLEEEQSHEFLMHYPEELYRKADNARVPCRNTFNGPREAHIASIGATNAIMEVLQAEFVGPLAEIPDLHGRVRARVMDQDVVQKIEAVLKRLSALAPPADDSTLHAETKFYRDQMWRRTTNIMTSQFKPLLMDIGVFFQRQRSVTNIEAFAQLFSRPKASVADTIGWIAEGKLKKELPRTNDGVTCVGGPLSEKLLSSLPPEFQPQVRRFVAENKVNVMSREEYEKHMRAGAEIAERFHAQFSADFAEYKKKQAEKEREAQDKQFK